MIPQPSPPKSARRVKWLFVIVLFLLGFLASWASSIRCGGHLRPPETHDEFSYILLAETLLKGRLANPTPAHWKHFETFHVLMRPTYASKYPIGQGAQLAVGKLLGHYLVGVWITMGLYAALLYLLLLLILPHGWAAAGSAASVLVVVAKLGWGSSYWGGSLFLLEGTLIVIGAVGTVRMTSALSAITIGIGTGMMAVTRPFEGFVFASSVIAVTFLLLLKNTGQVRLTASRLLLVLVFASPFIALIAAHNVKTTGSISQFPHTLWPKRYCPAIPLFIWDKRDINAEPKAEHRIFHTFNWHYAHTVGIDQQVKRILDGKMPRFFGLSGLLLVLSALLLLRQPTDKQLTYVLASPFVLLLPMYLVTNFALEHYFSPWFVTGHTLSIFALHRIACFSQLGHRSRNWILLSLFAVVIFNPLTTIARTLVGASRCSQDPKSFGMRRDTMQEEFADQKTLVLVRYAKNHRLQEWVYNEPDIRSAKVIWARSRGRDKDQKLLATYSGRKTVFLEIENKNVQELTEEQFYDGNNVCSDPTETLGVDAR